MGIPVVLWVLVILLMLAYGLLLVLVRSNAKLSRENKELKARESSAALGRIASEQVFIGYDANSCPIWTGSHIQWMLAKDEDNRTRRGIVVSSYRNPEYAGFPFRGIANLFEGGLVVRSDAGTPEESVWMCLSNEVVVLK